MARALKARIAALERAQGVGERHGLAALWILVHYDGMHGDVDVVAVEAGPPDGRVRFDRLPGESLADLELRANPRGCWRARPEPIFAPEIRPYEERTEEWRRQWQER